MFSRDITLHREHARWSQNGNKQQQQMVGAAIRQVFAAASREDSRSILQDVATRLERVAPKVARLLEDAEPDLLAFLDFPQEHRSKLRSTNPLERVNREIAGAPTSSASTPTTPR